MNFIKLGMIGVGVAVGAWSGQSVPVLAQAPPELQAPATSVPEPPAATVPGALALPGASTIPSAAPLPNASTPATSTDAPVKALTEGPLHEAFLSPAKDREPVHVEKSPPAPVVERPGVDPPDPRAQWIEGYWEWEESRHDFVWVTGTWRVAPPGRLWVNGYWKRDDQGWYRVAGFWSDRKTDRLDFRKDGPPADHPADEPGPSPGKDYFYVPGQYFPDGNGVVWKAGYWAKAQPGWAWVPAQWVKQPEGWVFQDGYWDRTLEDRGTLFAPAEVSGKRADGNTVYQPYTQVSPQSYGLLYGAFRPAELQLRRLSRRLLRSQRPILRLRPIRLDRQLLRLP